ncbi:MAG: T9SS type A sorting domain-containing protein [Bacteroidota bacterium]|nr:T9SS type A sorting domain-containing protein [Bacteroidota bacterium]
MRKLILLICFILFVCNFSNAQSNISWNTSMNIATSSSGNMHPRMTLDGKGNPLVIWGRMSDGAVFISRWTGTMFATPVKLNPAWLKVASASWMGPDIASKGDTVYVVVKRTPEAADTNYIYIMRSFDGGMSFSAPVRVDNIGDSISRFPTVSVDALGNPLVAFMKFNSSFLDSRWVVAKSSDYGVSFSKDVKASGYSGAAAEVCDCCPGAIVTSGSVSAVVYRDNLSNIRDIWTGISSNNGISFNRGFAVDKTNWFLQSCPASGPDAVIVGDSLYTVFMSGASTKNRIYLSRTSISTGIVNSVSTTSSNIASLNQQNFPRIATDGVAAAIVWQQSVGGVAQLPVTFTNDISKGFPLVYDTVDLVNITNMDIAMANGKIYVIWEDDNSGTVKFRSGTYKPLNTGNAKIVKSEPIEFRCFPNPASDVLNIVSPVEGRYVLNLFNALGEKVFTMESESSQSIELANFPKGIYFVRLIQTNDIESTQVFTQKIIKQ